MPLSLPRLQARPRLEALPRPRTAEDEVPASPAVVDLLRGLPGGLDGKLGAGVCEHVLRLWSNSLQMPHLFVLDCAASLGHLDFCVNVSLAYQVKSMPPEVADPCFQIVARNSYLVLGGSHPYSTSSNCLRRKNDGNSPQRYLL